MKRAAIAAALAVGCLRAATAVPVPSGRSTGPDGIVHCDPVRYPAPALLSDTNVEYMRAFGQPYRLDMAGPATSERLPLAVLVHGGGFTGGTRCAMNELASQYAERGFRAATISYPVCGHYVLEGEDLLAWDAEEPRVAPDPPGRKNKAPCAEPFETMPPMVRASIRALATRNQ